MQIEHLAFNFSAARELVVWYEDVLGMPVWVKGDGAIFVAFMGEPPSLLEIYDNPDHPHFEPERLDPLTFHLAFTSHDLSADLQRLLDAGAKHVEGDIDAQGNGLIMLRCPWGLPLQLCRRPQPLVRPVEAARPG